MPTYCYRSRYLQTRAASPAGAGIHAAHLRRALEPQIEGPDTARPFAVVSAMAGVTNALIAIAESAGASPASHSFVRHTVQLRAVVFTVSGKDGGAEAEDHRAG